jgi:hypothetical protein
MRIAGLIAVLVFGVFASPAHGQSACPWNPSIVSAGAKPVPMSAIARLAPNLSLKEIAAAIGPAARDVGMGVYVLQWDVSNGQIFSVSATTACSAPLARIFKKPN